MRVDAAELARSNIAYRDPGFYDELFVGDTTHADLVRALAAEHAPNAATLIDFGCGTARDLDQLSTTYQCAGVDLQPDLIAYARTVHPHLELHVSDVRDARLGRTADIIACLGNTLAYLPANDLTAAITTLATHTAPGGLVIIETLTTPPRPGRRQTATAVRGQQVDVTTDITYNADDALATMRRTWHFPNGSQITDNICRRITPTGQLTRLLTQAGLVTGFCYVENVIAAQRPVISAEGVNSSLGPTVQA